MNSNKGSNNQIVKKNNSNLILNLVITNQGISRIDIAKKTGLSKMTVSNIIAELIEEKILCETSIISNNSVGRRPITLDISDYSPYLCGIYIFRDKFVAVISTLKLEILERISIRLDEEENNDSLMKKIFKAIDNLKLKFSDKLKAIGISCVGPVDTVTGTILSPPNFHHIRDLNIKSLLENHTGLPVFLENDMNTSALCERLFGSGKEIENFIYVGITNGIGAGIISDGKLLVGSGGFAGEIGHITVVPDGRECYCKNKGCLESYASIPDIIRKLGENPSERSFESIVKEYQDSEIFHKIMKEISEYLVIALTGVCNILDPQTIILGHEGYFFPDSYLTEIEELINSKILTKGYKNINIIKSTFKNDIPIKGSLALILSRIFDGTIDLY